MGDVTDINSLAEFNKAKEEDSMMIVDCFAEWCGPCKAISPHFDKLSKTYPDGRFYRVDVDKVPDVAQELNIRHMPTFKVFKNGEPVDELVGAIPPKLEELVVKNLK